MSAPAMMMTAELTITAHQKGDFGMRTAISDAAAASRPMYDHAMNWKCSSSQPRAGRRQYTGRKPAITVARLRNAATWNGLNTPVSLKMKNDETLSVTIEDTYR